MNVQLCLVIWFHILFWILCLFSTIRSLAVMRNIKIRHRHRSLNSYTQYRSILSKIRAMLSLKNQQNQDGFQTKNSHWSSNNFKNEQKYDSAMTDYKSQMILNIQTNVIFQFLITPALVILIMSVRPACSIPSSWESLGRINKNSELLEKSRFGPNHGG
ncbi:unnamed protein product [Allacma fusca]|uniref:Uncharacterized protein n=1 Tax=Allacma fusca TaxID=39272 RepID=A0A8J2P667_9HEXA|nr:unnamed protein product [Allacma fusca]